jgi:hypothetical protein
MSDCRCVTTREVRSLGYVIASYQGIYKLTLLVQVYSKSRLDTLSTGILTRLVVFRLFDKILLYL